MANGMRKGPGQHQPLLSVVLQTEKGAPGGYLQPLEKNGGVDGI
jgi:hypothetical protein